MKRFEADSLRSGEIINLATFLSSNIKHDIRFFILILWTESKEKILDISYISTSVVKSTFDFVEIDILAMKGNKTVLLFKSKRVLLC